MPATLAFALFQVGAPLFLVNAVAGVGVLGAIVGAAVQVGIGIGVSYLASQLFRTPQPRPSDVQTIIKQAAAPRFRSYGRVKVGGLLVFAESKGPEFHRVIAMGSGEIDAVEEHWIDDRLVILNGAGEVDGGHFHRHDKSRVHVEYRLGTAAQAHYASLTSAFAEWTVNHKGNGLPHAYFRMRQTKAEDLQSVFPAASSTQYRQVQRAAKVASVAGGALTAKSWSENGARIILDYLTHPDGCRLSASWIVNAAAQWSAAIATADEAVALKDGGFEARWRLSGSYRFDERPADVLGRMLAAVDGVLMPTPSRGLALKVGKWEAPTVTIGPEAIVGFSEIGRGRDVMTTANTVRAQFTSPLHDYRETDADPWIDAADVTARGEVPIDKEFFMAPSNRQCRSLQKIAAHRAYPNWTGALTTNLLALPALGKRFVRVNLPELTIDEDFEILDVDFLIDERSVLTGLALQIASLGAAAYALSLAEQGTAPALPAGIVVDNSVPAPAGFDAAPGAAGVANLSWTAPDEDEVETTEAEGKASAATEWFPIIVAAGANTATKTGLPAGLHNFRIRHLSRTGRVSVYATYNATIL